ncbi:MAG: hypothetical protein K8R50_11425 [Betaproteobacteria bacterium]|nr:hypothetical protein [Betaproteobacteria bacterium]
MICCANRLLNLATNFVWRTKDPLFQVVAEELRHAHSTLFAKNDSMEIRAEGIHRLNSVLSGKEAAMQVVIKALRHVYQEVMIENIPE